MQGDQKIRILECIRQGQIGGGESHLLSLVENLDRSEFEPIVLSFTDGPMIERLRELGVETKVIHTLKPFDITKWKQVKRFISEKQVDIIHAHGTRAASNVLWTSRSLQLPLIYTIHGWSFHEDQSLLVKKIRVMGEKYLTRKSDLNISVSVSNQQSGKKYIPSFQSIVVNNGIDITKFNSENKFKDIRVEFGIAPEKILLLFIARFTFQKQPLSLIKAFKEASLVNPDLHLLMVGDGEQKAEAEMIIRQEDLENKITLVPFRQDVPDILAAADIYLLPSLWEGLPIGLLEAMAMGKTIIASNVDGTREIIEHMQNGFLVNTGNLIPELIQAIDQLSKNPDQREQFGEKAKMTVRNRFNASKMTKEIESLYRDLI
ncbi:MAG: glycosyltransferase family 4 protein [Chitinophagaceae bacterium]|nr:glycosyltransferase family 4 protein [Chitinophagaceae bacterium]